MRQQGLTLVELMISMVLGLLLTAGVMSLFIQSQKSYSATRDIAILDQNAQAIMDLIERDLQRIGYTPSCRTANGPNVANMAAVGSATTPFPMVGDRASQFLGYRQADTNAFLDATASGVAATLKPGSDYFMAWAPDPEKVGVVTGGTGSSYTATFPAAVDDLNNQVLVVTSPDCSQVSQFIQTVSTVDSSDPSKSKNVSPVAVNATADGVRNCSVNMKGNYSCATSPLPAASSDRLNAGGSLMVIDYFGYGINTNDELVRINAFSGSQTSSLLQGVTEFNLSFGSGAPSANGVYSVNRYDPPNMVANWANVIAVRIDFTLEGETFVASGTRFSKDYSRLVTLRNLVIQ